MDGRREVAGVLDARRDGRVGREREYERSGGGGGGEEGLDQGEVLRGDEDGEGEAVAEGEEAREVEERDEVALSREGDY